MNKILYLKKIKLTFYPPPQTTQLTHSVFLNFMLEVEYQFSAVQINISDL